MTYASMPHHGSAPDAAKSRRHGRLKQSTRLAAMLLLFIWVGPVTFVQTDSWTLMHLMGAPGRASADSGTIPAGQAVTLDPGTVITLKMRDGSKLEGRFLGRTLLDSSFYVPRYEHYARSANYVPLTRGEMLDVILRDGRNVSGAFAGYAELTMLLVVPEGLEGAEGSSFLRVPFEFAGMIRRANGATVDPSDLARAFKKHQLPSAEALVIGERAAPGSTADQWASALRVPVDDIKSVNMDISSVESSSGGAGIASQAVNVAGAVILGVLVGVVLIAIIASSQQPSVSCSEAPHITLLSARLPAGVHLTGQAFDRSRGCYAGDALAVATPWSPTSDAPTAVLDGPSSGTSAR